MKQAIADRLDEINLTVAAIDDVSSMLLEDEKAGGQCLWVLHKKLRADLDLLWEGLKIGDR